MRTRLAILLLLPITACSPAPDSQHVGQRATDIEALRTAKVQTWRQLYRDQDAEGLANFLVDDFVVIGADGVISTKAEEVAWLAGNAWSGPDDFQYIIEDIVFHSTDVAMVYGHGRATRITDGKPECIETYRSSNLFRRNDGRWRPAFSHLSGVACVSEEEFVKRYARKETTG